MVQTGTGIAVTVTVAVTIGLHEPGPLQPRAWYVYVPAVGNKPPPPVPLNAGAPPGFVQ